MPNRKKFCRTLIATLVTTSIMMWSASATPPLPVAAQAIPNGIVYSKLAADWWKWAFSFPVSINPLFDETGAQGYLGNQRNVFFLAGVINVSGTATRTLTVPAGKPLFFPLLNAVWDNVGASGPYQCEWPPTEPKSIPELYAAVSANIDMVSELHASVDGQPIANLFNYRARSAPFSYTLPPADNIYQVSGCNVSGVIYPAVADGYWLLLAPLSPGQHTINFGGTNGGFTLDVTYHLTVTQ